jgi:phosphoribosyl 1,2-cyclic phosphodiesterase
MDVALWGVRGSIPVADRSFLRYGGNTSCVEVRLDDGTIVVLDAGTGIRPLGRALAGADRPIHLLLTHLHLDHIMGLLFFAPMLDPTAEIVVWGPPARRVNLRDRLARYLSAPLSPLEIRELPARVDFRAAPPEPFRLGSATVRAALVNHRGTTLGFRIDDGDSSLAYLPDHEPALGQDLATDRDEWVSGLALARGASLLLHDGQYTEEEYRSSVGWGHSSIPDVLTFAARSEAARTILFHHDPGHDDAKLDAIAAEARTLWTGPPAALELAAEGVRYLL